MTTAVATENTFTGTGGCVPSKPVLAVTGTGGCVPSKPVLAVTGVRAVEVATHFVHSMTRVLLHRALIYDTCAVAPCTHL